MKVNRFIKVQLFRPNRSKWQRLMKVLLPYRDGFIQAWRACYPLMMTGESSIDRQKIHTLVYPIAREMGCSAAFSRCLVTDVLAALRTCRKTGWDESQPVPVPRDYPLPGNAYKVRINKDRAYLQFFDRGDKILFPIQMPKKFFDQVPFIHGDGRIWAQPDEICVHRNLDWWALLPYEIPDHLPPKRVAGIDLGEVRLVVMATCEHTRVWSGVQYHRTLMQLTEHVCLLIARGRFEKAEDAQRELHTWMRHINGFIAQQVLDSIPPETAIALESTCRICQLKNERASQRNPAWDFRELGRLISEKAKASGIDILFVDPRGTSTMCPRCGERRRTEINGPVFHCQSCGYRGNRDIVAAKNIRLRGEEILSRQLMEGSTTSPR